MALLQRSDRRLAERLTSDESYQFEENRTRTNEVVEPPRWNGSDGPEARAADGLVMDQGGGGAFMVGSAALVQLPGGPRGEMLGNVGMRWRAQ
jgi:hypothetical protein